MTITWAPKIVVRNVDREEISITAIREDSNGPTTKTFRVLSALIATPEQKIAVLEIFMKMVLDWEAKEAAKSAVIDDLEDSLKTALETWEQER